MIIHRTLLLLALAAHLEDTRVSSFSISWKATAKNKRTLPPKDEKKGDDFMGGARTLLQASAKVTSLDIANAWTKVGDDMDTKDQGILGEYAELRDSFKQLVNSSSQPEGKSPYSDLGLDQVQATMDTPKESMSTTSSNMEILDSPPVSFAPKLENQIQLSNATPDSTIDSTVPSQSVSDPPVQPNVRPSNERSVSRTRSPLLQRLNANANSARSENYFVVSGPSTRSHPKMKANSGVPRASREPFKKVYGNIGSRPAPRISIKNPERSCAPSKTSKNRGIASKSPLSTQTMIKPFKKSYGDIGERPAPRVSIPAPKRSNAQSKISKDSRISSTSPVSTETAKKSYGASRAAREPIKASKTSRKPSFFSKVAKILFEDFK